jgi:hypothetical protein
VALLGTNISTAVVNTELGSPYTTPRIVRQLCIHPNAGTPWSFYGVGTLGVDANKNVVWTAPSSNYKLGDFRFYNRTASAASGPDNLTHYWGPSGSTTDFPVVSFPNALNVLFVNAGATYITYKIYTSSANRTAESGGTSQIQLWSGSTITALTGHTRTQTKKIDTIHVDTFTGYSTVGFGSSVTRYGDVYISDVSGNRLMNLGSSKSDGYFDITFIKNVSPLITESGLAPTPWPVSPTFTALFPALGTSSTPCASGSIAGGSIGTTNISFYVGIHGISGSNTYSVAATNFTIRITYDGSTKDVSLGTLNANAKRSVSTTLPGGKSWAYNKNAAISIVSSTFAAFPSTFTC